MKNLMKRKVVLGVLMACVLGFGVQGVAEGVDEPTFAQTEANIIDLRAPGTNVTVTVPTLALDNPTVRESVTISGTSGIVITSGIGVGKPSVTYTETDNDLTDTSNGEISSADVNITFTSVGRKTVTISSIDYTQRTDADDNPIAGSYSSRSWSFQYIYYVSQAATNPTTTVGLVDQGYQYPYWPGIPEKVHNGSGNYSVTYSPNTSLDIRLSTADIKYLTDDGDGVVDVPATAVSSAFNVYLKPSLTATQTITARVSGATQVSTTAVYIN